MLFEIGPLREMYFTYVGYKPHSFFRHIYETAITGALSWIPGLLGVIVRNVGYRLILDKIGKLTMVSKNVNLICCGSIILEDRAKLRERVKINAYSRKTRIHIGYNVSINPYTSVKCKGANIIIGKNTFISSFVNIYAEGEILIGDNVLIAHNCNIETGKHGYQDLTIPIKDQRVKSKGIIIEDDCWLGSGVTVLDGVRIGKGAVIGAGAVVISDIQEYSIAVGIPAKVIGSRLEKGEGSLKWS